MSRETGLMRFTLTILAVVVCSLAALDSSGKRGNVVVNALLDMTIKAD